MLGLLSSRALSPGDTITLAKGNTGMQQPIAILPAALPPLAQYLAYTLSYPAPEDPAAADGERIALAHLSGLVVAMLARATTPPSSTPPAQ